MTKKEAIKKLMAMIERQIEDIEDDETLNIIGSQVANAISFSAESNGYDWRDCWQDLNEEEYNRFVELEKVFQDSEEE